MRILITGGAGYIGSHTLLQLLKVRHEVCVYDNFSNSSPESLSRVRQLTNSDFEVREGDIQNSEQLESVFAEVKPEAAIHFAGLKAVGESQEVPLKYYAHNVTGSIELLKAMQRHGCRNLVFSSSATVYGKAKYLPYDENHPISPTNTYGRTKYFVEEIIQDWTSSTAGTSAVLLRYFNPVGADASGRIGEDPSGIPNNLAPFISQVAVGRRKCLNIFGSDYDTRDGTGERDYIHVEDLARGHLAALDFASSNNGCEAINLGTGRGTTVLELVAAFEKASGKSVSYNFSPRRDGDVARSVAAVGKAERLLGWKSLLSIDDMCRTSWRWQSENPNGYHSQE